MPTIQDYINRYYELNRAIDKRIKRNKPFDKAINELCHIRHVLAVRGALIDVIR